METFDCAVIGSGPGGYVAAILASKAGMKTALVEKYPVLGGTCLNVGCIPSKALLDAAEKYYSAKNHASKIGIEFSKLGLNWPKMLAFKNQVIDENNKGLDFLMKKNKVTVFHGEGSLQTANSILIENRTEKKQIEAKKIILATGSKPASLPGVAFDKKVILSSTEALSIDEIPQKLLIIGGGVIGLELGSVFKRLGAKVEVVEFFDRILPNFDSGISKEMLSILKKQGLEFYLEHKVESVVVKNNQVQLSAQDKDQNKLNLEADYVLIATGRKPYTKNLGLEKVGIKTDSKGFIVVDAELKTNLPNIYALGDVIGGLMLAHKAEEEAAYVVEVMQGQKPRINHELIPSVVYTWPEVASVGKTEEECKKMGLPLQVGQFPFKALGRARASGDLEGWVKILAHQTTDEILGCHIVGARAVDLIMEVAVAMTYKASAEDVARICHPHPTFSEGIKEASFGAWNKQYLHS